MFRTLSVASHEFHTIDLRAELTRAFPKSGSPWNRS